MGPGVTAPMSFGARVSACARDHGVEVRGVDLGESSVYVEFTVVLAPASGAVANRIGNHILVMDLQGCRASATSTDSGQRAATEIQVEIVVAQTKIQPGIPASSEYRSGWAMKQVPEERGRQTSLKLPAHSPVSVVGSM